MFSVTSETAASLSFQAPPPRSAKPDPSQGNDRFQALIDSTAAADTADDRANAAAQQQPVSQRRADDAPATADTKRSRDAGPADQAGRNNSEDRDATSRQSSDCADSQRQHRRGSAVRRRNQATLKADTAKPIEKKSTDPKVTSDTASAPDFSSAPDSSSCCCGLSQRDAASVTTPNPIAAAIAVAIRRDGYARRRLRPAMPPRRSRLPRRQSLPARQRQPHRLHHQRRAIQMHWPL